MRTMAALVAMLTMMATALVSAPDAQAQAGESYFVLYGTPGDYVSQGNDVFFAEDTDTLFVPSVNFDNGISVRIDVFNGGSFQERWQIDAAAPGDVALAAGDEFEATRFPFQAADSGGLSATGAGRGCNQLTGEFAVRELALAADGSVEQFALDFRQSCDGGPATVGGVRINSTLDNPDPDFTIGEPPPPVDTTPPTTTAFLDQTGKVRGTSSNFFVIASCADDNPGATLVSAEINGVAVADGDKVKLTISHKTRTRVRNGKLIMLAPSITLTVTCMDAAGNTSSATAIPVYD